MHWDCILGLVIFNLSFLSGNTIVHFLLFLSCSFLLANLDSDKCCILTLVFVDDPFMSKNIGVYIFKGPVSNEPTKYFQVSEPNTVNTKCSCLFNCPGFVLQGESGKEVAFGLLTLLSHLCKAKYKSPFDFEQSLQYFCRISFRKMAIVCLLKSI